MRKIHEFDNGVKVFDDQLLEIQRERYKRRNVHEEDEEDVFISLVEKLPENGVYVNVGTAIGYYPLLARTLRKDLSIHCFEPLPSHLVFFRENIGINGFSESDFNLSQTAISAESGEVRFADNSFGSSLCEGYGTDGKKKRFSSRLIKRKIRQLLGKPLPSNEMTVAAIKLADVFQEIGSDRIDLMQMDIQGYEAPVFDSYFSRGGSGGMVINTMLIGTHGEKVHNTCRDLLLQGGYTILQDEHESQHQPDGILVASLTP